MGPWNIYFICKLVLHCAGSIALHPLLNLCLIAALLTPVPVPFWRRLRQPAMIIAAAALLYYESFLPPLRSLLREAGGLSGFSLDYLADVAVRVIDPKLALWVVVLVTSCMLVRRWLRVSAFVLLAVLIVPLLPLPRSGATAMAGVAEPSDTSTRAGASDGARLTPASSAAELDRAVAQFFTDQSHRMLLFPHVARNIDIIFIHVCSLAWDDLRSIGLARHPLLDRFDVLYTHFNSAASYSGPAAIRLLRGACGQPRHDALYDAASQDCLLMVRLQQAGFAPQLLMNHDGHYGHFREDLERRGGFEVAPQPTTGARIALRGFDGSPIAEDYDVLHDWWQRRLATHEPRVALYYNTISLHDGNRSADGTSWRREYPHRAQRLLDDIDHFIGDLEASGARAIIVFIPEHGAAFHAAPGQIAGLRQMPGANVTEVPVGVRLVGLPLREAQRPLRIDASTSYLGLNLLLANVMTAADTDADRIDLAQILAHPFTTPFVAENDGLLVVRAGDGYFTRGPDGRWSP